MGTLARLLERRANPAVADPAIRPAAEQRAARPSRREDSLHAAGLSIAELRFAWIAASWLLSYPDESALSRLDQVRALALTVPGAAGEGLLGCVEALQDRDALEVQQEYVDTFDTRRRGCLYLTYFSQGDTRRRGMALVRIKQDFRAAGVEAGDEELCDHLPLVLEFAAAHDPERGAKILRQNRPGIELLRLHLAETGSPWHGALLAVCATLPPLDADDRTAVLRLAEEGPEAEEVGLDGYGIEGDAAALAAQTFAASNPSASCGSGAAAPGPVPVDIMRGRPS